MRLLDRYIFREVTGPFLFGMAAFCSILFASMPLRQSIVLLVEHHVAARDAALYLLYETPGLIAMTFPMAVLLGTLLGIGRLSSDNEAAAMLAGGVSFYRLVAPALALGLLVSGIAFWFNEMLVPQANAASEALMIRVGRRKVEQPEGALVLKDVKNGVLRRLIVARRFDTKTGTLIEPQVLFYRDGRPYLILLAEEATSSVDPVRNPDSWQTDRWRFRHGTLQSIGARDGKTYNTTFDELDRSLGKTPAQVEREARRVRPSQLRLHELRAYIETLQRHSQGSQENLELSKARVEYDNRYAIPLSSFLFALIGAPLAMRPKRTTLSIAFGMSVVIILLYYLLWYNASWLGHAGRLSPLVASWSANVVMGCVGLILLIRNAH